MKTVPKDPDAHSLVVRLKVTYELFDTIFFDSAKADPFRRRTLYSGGLLESRQELPSPVPSEPVLPLHAIGYAGVGARSRSPGPHSLLRD